jgi:hypothetical protein
MAEISCPGEEDRLGNPFTAPGTGYGKTKDDALSAARAQAKAKLDATVADYECAAGCDKEVEAEPDYDSKRPAYKPYPGKNSKSFQCDVETARPAKIICKAKSGSMIVDFGPDPILTLLSETLQLLGENESSEDTIAFVSFRRKTITVRMGFARQALAALKATKSKQGWKVPPTDAVLSLHEIDGNPLPTLTPKEDGGHQHGLPRFERGAIRVRLNRECGRPLPEREGPCRKLADNLWAQTTYLSFARCSRFKENALCTEDFDLIGYGGFYSDSDCIEPITEWDILGWSCI